MGDGGQQSSAGSGLVVKAKNEVRVCAVMALGHYIPPWVVFIFIALCLWIPRCAIAVGIYLSYAGMMSQYLGHMACSASN
jgi:hypothetical protein